METEKKAYFSMALFAVLLIALIAMVAFKVNVIAIWVVAAIEFVIAVFGLFPHCFEGEEY